jgi:bifunctional non-homologous end joining protein LigD
MALEEYRRKRDFEKTPEPRPKPVAETKSADQPRFYIQRHDATRLHYDFRLEIGGVLVSWAVPKGPSLEPLSKVLAMHVEDHPLEYGPFEGNIPKGEYGGGSVMQWDNGTWELLGTGTAQEQIARGDLKFRLHGEKVKGEFAIVLMKGRGKGNEWLLIKKKDADAQPGWNIEDYAYSVSTGRTQQQIAENIPPVKKATKPRNTGAKKKGFDVAALKGAVKAGMPAQITPMMATLESSPPASENWLYEIKWDGVRALCFVEDGRLEMYSRNGNRCTQQYPELSVLPHYLNATTAILDGEIAALDPKGRPTFNLIQPRIMVTDPNSIAHLSRSNPVHLFLFDVLYLDGYDLRAVPLLERKRVLTEILTPADYIRLSDYFREHGREMLEAARQNGLEGIIAKRIDSPYESRRSPNWVKVKATNEAEFVIGGFLKGERSYFGSLILGSYENGKLKHTGQVGTGFTERTLKHIYDRLEPLITTKSPFSAAIKNRLGRDVTWVKPELVAQIKYLEITPDGLLRAPVFLGLRTDKPATEVVVEQWAPSGHRPVSPLIPENATADLTINIDGQPLKFTNPSKVWFPKDGIKKRDVINYYDSIADLILPHLRDRPLSLKRYPNGIDEEYFFQKHAEDKVPAWVRLEPIDSEHRGSPIHYIIANDRATLLYLTNLACIDQNPWMSRIGSLENPDFALIDLDPLECSYDKIVEAAQLVHNKLDLLGLEGYPKTTGGDGMHIYIPLEPVYTYEQVRSFAELLSILVIGDQPDLFTTPRAVAKRKKDKVYFDYLQISTGKTIAGPYVLRAHPGAPVSTPLKWSEVKKGLRPEQFHIHNARARFDQVGDLFAPVLTKPQRIEGAIEKMGPLLTKP